MKKLLFACASLLVMAACTQKPATTGYTISGTAEGTEDGDTVFLCEMQGFFSMVPLDTAIIQDGKFEFKGETEGASLRFLLPIHKGEPTTFAQIILENAEIKAQLVKGEGESKIEGGPNAKLYAEYTEGEKVFNKQMEEPWRASMDSTLTEEERNAAKATVDSLQQLLTDYHKKFITDHVPSALSDMLLAYNIQNYTDEELEELLKLFGEKQPDYPVYKSIMAEREATAATAIGHEYTDFEMPSADGKAMKISDFVGKSPLVLVDFWASWCGPCRAEMPHVLKAYEQYHQQGFEIVGVSLDNNKDAWLKAIDQLKLPWPQMSDLKGWESEGAKKYNVRSIPANVLLDKDGKIVAKDLRGEELAERVGQLLQ